MGVNMWNTGDVGCRRSELSPCGRTNQSAVCCPSESQSLYPGANEEPSLAPQSLGLRRAHAETAAS